MSIEKKLYWKVYQSIENMDVHYISTGEEIERNMPSWEEELREGELPPVFEPVLMTEAEFENLPEFSGY